MSWIYTSKKLLREILWIWECDPWYSESKRDAKSRRVSLLGHFSRVWLCVTLRTVARQAPLSMGFSRQGYWSGLPHPSPRRSLTRGSNPRLLHLLHCKQVLCPLGCLGSPLTHVGCMLSRVWLCATPWTVTHQAPLSMGFPRQNAGVGYHSLLQGSFPMSLRGPCTGRRVLYLCATGNRYRDSNLPATPFLHCLH